MTEEIFYPDDWKIPRWEEYDKVHGWRNYASDDIQVNWNSFTTNQKKWIATMLQNIANTERWD